jgi:hypothetical protein
MKRTFQETLGAKSRFTLSIVVMVSQINNKCQILLNIAWYILFILFCSLRQGLGT